MTTEKPKCWYKYMGVTLVIWPRGNHKPQQHLEYLNSINPGMEQYNYKLNKN